MGKTANARAWAEYERRQNRAADEYFEPTEPLSEAERASEWETFEQFRDEKCLREVNLDFDRVFGVGR